MLSNTFDTSYNKKEIISVITVWEEAVLWCLSKNKSRIQMRTFKKHSQVDQVLVVPTMTWENKSRTKNWQRSTGRSATRSRKRRNSCQWPTFLWHALGMSQNSWNNCSEGFLFNMVPKTTILQALLTEKSFGRFLLKNSICHPILKGSVMNTCCQRIHERYFQLRLVKLHPIFKGIQR